MPPQDLSRDPRPRVRGTGSISAFACSINQRDLAKICSRHIDRQLQTGYKSAQQLLEEAEAAAIAAEEARIAAIRAEREANVDTDPWVPCTRPKDRKLLLSSML